MSLLQANCPTPHAFATLESLSLANPSLPHAIATLESLSLANCPTARDCDQQRLYRNLPLHDGIGQMTEINRDTAGLRRQPPANHNGGDASRDERQVVID